MQKLFEQTESEAGKAKLAAARRGGHTGSVRHRPVRIDPVEVRRRYSGHHRERPRGAPHLGGTKRRGAFRRRHDQRAEEELGIVTPDDSYGTKNDDNYQHVARSCATWSDRPAEIDVEAIAWHLGARVKYRDSTGARRGSQGMATRRSSR